MCINSGKLLQTEITFKKRIKNVLTFVALIIMQGVLGFIFFVISMKNRWFDSNGGTASFIDDIFWWVLAAYAIIFTGIRLLRPKLNRNVYFAVILLYGALFWFCIFWFLLIGIATMM
jgi:hypothetical protein